MLTDIECELLIKLARVRKKFARNVSKQICTLSHAVKVFKKFEDKGIVVRKAKQGRRISMELTPKGKRIINLIVDIEHELQ